MDQFFLYTREPEKTWRYVGESIGWLLKKPEDVAAGLPHVLRLGLQVPSLSLPVLRPLLWPASAIAWLELLRSEDLVITGSGTLDEVCWSENPSDMLFHRVALTIRLAAELTSSFLTPELSSDLLIS